MINHPTPLAWSYIVLFGGLAIVFVAFGIAIRARRNQREENPRLEALDDQLSRGEISQETYDRLRAEILIEEYDRHRAA
jgi:uncharacterized membrane protein